MRSSSPTAQGHLGEIKRFLSTIAAAVKFLRNVVSRIYFGIFGFLASPFSWLLRKIQGIDQRMLARATSRGRGGRFVNWLLRLPVRFLRWLLEWTMFLIVDGPLLLIGLAIIVGVFVVFVGIPIMYSKWVGGLWYGGLFLWLVFRANPAWWWRGIAKIGGLVAIGVTPQFIFLLLYNGLPQGGIRPPVILDTIIKSYEYFAVSLNDLLAPIGDVAWYWWAAGACALLIVSWVLEAPTLLDRMLRLRQTLAALVFTVSITSSCGFSCLVAVDNWQPDVQLRLQAGLKEQSFYEATIRLSQDLTLWFTSNRSRPTVLPIYVRSFEDAIQEIRSGAHATSEDISKGTKQAARTLVPSDAANIAIADGGLHPAQARMPGTIDELLRFDSDLKRSNLELKVRANQIRASAVNVISQIVNVPVSSIPMLREILGEMINVTAEQISQRVVDRLPIERGIKIVRSTVETVHKSVSTNSDKLAEALFASKGPIAVDGIRADLALHAMVAREIGKVATARVQAARSRSPARARR